MNTEGNLYNKNKLFDIYMTIVLFKNTNKTNSTVYYFFKATTKFYLLFNHTAKPLLPMDTKKFSVAASAIFLFNNYPRR